jgi:hypothetical protein
LLPEPLKPPKVQNNVHRQTADIGVANAETGLEAAASKDAGQKYVNVADGK